MALSEAALKREFLGLFGAMRRSPMGEEEYAERMAKIVTDYVKTATVEVSAGIPVATPAGPGSTSAPGTGRLT